MPHLSSLATLANYHALPLARLASVDFRHRQESSHDLNPLCRAFTDLTTLTGESLFLSH